MTLTIQTIRSKHKLGIQALLKDLNQADKLGYSLTDEWLDFIIAETSESVFVGIYHNELVGIATCMINEIDHTQAVINIAVHPAYRSQGIGTQLYKRVISYANYKNIKTMETYVKERLPHAVAFAEKIGFQSSLYAWQLDLDLHKAQADPGHPDEQALTFRKATIKDKRVYAKIINETFGDSLDHSVLGHLLKDPSITVYILEKSGQAIGSTSLQIKTDLSLGYIYDVAILAPFRAQGFGSYMLTKCIQVLQNRNMAIASLSVTGKNKQALALYHRLGFQEVDLDLVGSVPVVVL